MLVIELVQCNIDELIIPNTRQEDLALQILEQSLQALVHMEKNIKVLHRNISPRNIFKLKENHYCLNHGLGQTTH